MKSLLVILLCYSSSLLALTGVPSKNEQSIAVALSVFNIIVPSFVTVVYAGESPKEGECLVRGHTAEKNKGSKEKVVFVYDSAFSSWGMLGSTLAHEIEVHAIQDFDYIRKKDQIFGNSYGQNRAEADAYQYELMNSNRFQLTDNETTKIQQQLSEYQAQL